MIKNFGRAAWLVVAVIVLGLGQARAQVGLGGFGIARDSSISLPCTTYWLEQAPMVCPGEPDNPIYWPVTSYVPGGPEVCLTPGQYGKVTMAFDLMDPGHAR